MNSIESHQTPFYPHWIPFSSILFYSFCYALIGAGKTTTISMLTGMIDITQGSANAFGLDIGTQLDQLRTKMGVCP